MEYSLQLIIITIINYTRWTIISIINAYSSLAYNYLFYHIGSLYTSIMHRPCQSLSTCNYWIIIMRMCISFTRNFSNCNFSSSFSSLEGVRYIYSSTFHSGITSHFDTFQVGLIRIAWQKLSLYNNCIYTEFTIV